MEKKAVVLLSGGLDSLTSLAIVKSEGYECYALSFDYGQSNSHELKSAAHHAKSYDVVIHKILKLPLNEIKGSALTDETIAIPDYETGDFIPPTYVPARNTIFLTFALAWAEVIGAYTIVIGSSFVDYSGYPDCRPVYFKAFQALADLATKSSVEGKKFNIYTPLLHLSKAETILKGLSLGVDYSYSLTCYRADANQGKHCGTCPSCVLRAKGFSEAAVADPAVKL